MNISNENLNLENELLEEIENLLEQFDEVEEIELPDDLELQELQEANVYSVIATKQDSSRDFTGSADKPNPVGKNRAEIYKRKIYAKTPQDAIAKFKKLQGADSKYIREPRVVKTVPAEKAKTDRLGRKAGRGYMFLKHKDDPKKQFNFGVKSLDKKNAHVRVVTKTDKGLKPGFRNKSGELEHPYKKLHIKHKDRAPIKRAVYTHIGKNFDPENHMDNTPLKYHIGEGKIMEQKIRELIDSIESGKSENINSAFTSVMANKVSSKLDSIRQELAATMFRTETETEQKTEQKLEPEIKNESEKGL
jgi:hypothetical protein